MQHVMPFPEPNPAPGKKVVGMFTPSEKGGNEQNLPLQSENRISADQGRKSVVRDIAGELQAELEGVCLYPEVREKKRT